MLRLTAAAPLRFFPRPQAGALEGAMTAGLHLQAVIDYAIPCESVSRIKEFEKPGFTLELEALPCLLAHAVESAPVPTVLCGNELSSGGQTPERTFKGNRQNPQYFRGRARIYGQNAAILRLLHKDIQPEQKK